MAINLWIEAVLGDGGGAWKGHSRDWGLCSILFSAVGAPCAPIPKRPDWSRQQNL